MHCRAGLSLPLRCRDSGRQPENSRIKARIVTSASLLVLLKEQLELGGLGRTNRMSCIDRSNLRARKVAPRFWVSTRQSQGRGRALDHRRLWTFLLPIRLQVIRQNVSFVLNCSTLDRLNI